MVSYVNWERIPKEYNYVAVQPNKTIFMFAVHPNFSETRYDTGWWTNARNAIMAIEVPTEAIVGELPQWDKSLISRYDKQEIIGWPGNVEEMRQYIGRQCVCCDDINFAAPSVPGAFEIGNDDGEMPYSNDNSGYFRYCKILPEPAITELTLSDALKAYSDAHNIPVDQLRIKEQR